MKKYLKKQNKLNRCANLILNAFTYLPHVLYRNVTMNNERTMSKAFYLNPVHDFCELELESDLEEAFVLADRVGDAGFNAVSGDKQM